MTKQNTKQAGEQTRAGLILRLKAERSGLTQKKNSLDQRLSEMKNLIRTSGRMPGEKYATTVKAQNECLREKAAIENQIQNINSQILNHRSDFESDRQSSDKKQETFSIIPELVFIRDYYQQFSADSTRVSSMKQMAAEFVLKLNPLIKKAIQKTPA